MHVLVCTSTLSYVYDLDPSMVPISRISGISRISISTPFSLQKQHTSGSVTRTVYSHGANGLNSRSSRDNNPGNCTLPPVSTMLLHSSPCICTGTDAMDAAMASASPACCNPKSDGLNRSSGTRKRSLFMTRICSRLGGLCVLRGMDGVL